MAGTINLSLQQQFDSRGLPLGGGKLYCFQSGTSTPQSAYKDIGLTITHTNPVELDASGRVPQMFFADGTIKLRLTNRDGAIVVFEADFLPVLGASSGGSGGTGVDATTTLATGDVKARYGTGTLNGFVRANGRTIGSGSSPASERANLDCNALFEYLWNADSTLAVSGGRGATANADWLANKTITLPDMRGRVLAGMDDMGFTSAARLSSLLSSTTLGAAGGAQNIAIAAGNLPAVKPTGSIVFSTSGTSQYTPQGNVVFANSGNNAFTPAGTISGNGGVINATIHDPGHHHQYNDSISNNASGIAAGHPTRDAALGANTTDNFTNITVDTASNAIAATLAFTGTANSASFTGVATLAGFNGDNLGAGAALAIAQPTMVITLYIKL